jgi:hypothetical protein
MSTEEQTPEQIEHLTIYQAHWLAEFKRQNAALERIAQALEDIQVNISEVAAK